MRIVSENRKIPPPPHPRDRRRLSGGLREFQRRLVCLLCGISKVPGPTHHDATLLLAQYTGRLRGLSDQSHYSPVVTRMRLSRCGFYLFIFSSEDGSVSCILYLVFFPSKSEKDIFLSLRTFLVLHFALGISSRCLRLRRKLLVRSSRGR